MQEREISSTGPVTGTAAGGIDRSGASAPRVVDESGRECLIQEAEIEYSYIRHIIQEAFMA